MIEGFSENLENTVLVDFSYDADTKTFSYVLETTTEVYGEHVESESEKASGSGSGTEHVVVDFVDTFLQDQLQEVEGVTYTQGTPVEKFVTDSYSESQSESESHSESTSGSTSASESASAISAGVRSP